MSGYDLIGDTHGFADQHEELLGRLGYYAYKHPQGRKIIYLGDAINRGPQQAHNLSLHMAMVREGTAQMIMGNHEFKAIAYARKFKGGYLRPHTVENYVEHAQFLEEFPFGSKQHQEAIKFFKSLPLYIRKKEFNVVHAFWDAAAIGICTPHLNKKTHALKDSAYTAFGNQAAHGKKQAGAVRRSLDLLMKGPVFSLPEGVTVVKSTGEIKSQARLFWWRDAGEPITLLADKGDQFLPQLSEKGVQDFLSFKAKFNYSAQKPLFIGHYNLTTEAGIGESPVACLNYKDKIVAYRWDEGDKALDPAKLVCV